MRETIYWVLDKQLKAVLLIMKALSFIAVTFTVLIACALIGISGAYTILNPIMNWVVDLAVYYRST